MLDLTFDPMWSGKEMLFFAIWGKKKNENRLGFAADFCEICRSITAHEVCSIGLATHVYFVAIEDGRFLGHTQRCVSCDTTTDSIPSRFQSLAKTLDPSIDRLAQLTYPAIYQEFAERLMLEENIRSDPHAFDADFRSKLLLEAFELTAPYFKNRGRETGLNILAKVLKPLDPSEEEVHKSINHFRKIRSRMGGLISTEMVMKKLIWNASNHDFDY